MPAAPDALPIELLLGDVLLGGVVLGVVVLGVVLLGEVLPVALVSAPVLLPVVPDVESDMLDVPIMAFVSV